LRAEGLVAIWLVLALPCAGAAEVEPPTEPARLTVEITGLLSEEGKLAVALFDSEAGFKKRRNPVRKAFLPIDPTGCAWVVEGLPAGEYAVAVYHDVNSNGKLDKRPHGPPKEPYGFSNDARGTFGPPSFDRAKFALEGDRTIRIEVR
jgi:uncharacterized protein (DUF2141 family)